MDAGVLVSSSSGSPVEPRRAGSDRCRFAAYAVARMASTSSARTARIPCDAIGLGSPAPRRSEAGAPLSTATARPVQGGSRHQRATAGPAARRTTPTACGGTDGTASCARGRNSDDAKPDGVCQNAYDGADVQRRTTRASQEGYPRARGRHGRRTVRRTPRSSTRAHVVRRISSNACSSTPAASISGS